MGALGAYAIEKTKVFAHQGHVSHGQRAMKQEDRGHLYSERAPEFSPFPDPLAVWTRSVPV